MSDLIFSVSDYLDISVEGFGQGMGDWCFAEAAFGQKRCSSDSDYLTHLDSTGTSERTLEALRHARRYADIFIDFCVHDLLSDEPRLIGFTTGFQQTVASVAVARRLKERAPATRIVFGGADCSGAMGEGLIRAFQCIDAVVRGEGEQALLQLARDTMSECATTPFAGLCYREDGLVRAVPSSHGNNIPPDDIPTPDYTDYFARLRKSVNRAAIAPVVEMPVESSRGCWWGQKHHCMFCGFNGSEMLFRSRSAARFLKEVQTLVERHKCHSLMATDAIIDPKYFSTVMPRLAEETSDLSFFYETKANLKESHVFSLRQAGVMHVQPGIESLSTNILKMMKKGTSALQNIKVLKWCRQYGINALWNIIYGFPGEDPSDYEAMAQLAPKLAHLQPPSLVPLVLDRFSPYQMAPDAHGIEITGPPSHFAWTMSCEPEVKMQWENLCCRFEYRHNDGRDPESYVVNLRKAITRWHETFSWEKPSFRYRRGPNFLTLYDERPDFPVAHYRLEQAFAEVYLACDHGASPAQVVARLDLVDSAIPRIRKMLTSLTDRGFMVEEDDQFLTLAIPVRTLGVPYLAGI